jgi:hypothetical protein
MRISFLRYYVHSAESSQSKARGLRVKGLALRKHYSAVELIVIGANGAWGRARGHCVRYVMAITKKRLSLPNCAERTAHSSLQRSGWNKQRPDAVSLAESVLSKENNNASQGRHDSGRPTRFWDCLGRFGGCQ